jgi:hypothetical protein
MLPLSPNYFLKALAHLGKLFKPQCKDSWGRKGSCLPGTKNTTTKPAICTQEGWFAFWTFVK